MTSPFQPDQNVHYTGHRSGKTRLQQQLAITESLEGKEVWVINNETTDIYVAGKIDRTVPTDTLFRGHEQRGERMEHPDDVEHANKGDEQFYREKYAAQERCQKHFYAEDLRKGVRTDLGQCVLPEGHDLPHSTGPQSS